LENDYPGFAPPLPEVIKPPPSTEERKLKFRAN